MTREEAINEIKKVFEHAYANYIVIAITEGATVSDKAKQECEDCVSRQAVHDMLENLPVTVENKWFNWLQKACMRLAELPSVNPTSNLDKVRAEISKAWYTQPKKQIRIGVKRPSIKGYEDYRQVQGRK